MSSDPKIRPIKIWEIQKLLKFRSKNDYRASAGVSGQIQSLPHAILKFMWYGKRIRTLIAERDGRILGYITLVLGRQGKFMGNLYIANGSVEEAERGKGIFTLLFQEVEQYAKSLNVHRIDFEVFARNHKAIELYKRLGYEIEGVKRQAIANGSEFDDLVFMAKLLN